MARVDGSAGATRRAPRRADRARRVVRTVAGRGWPAVHVVAGLHDAPALTEHAGPGDGIRRIRHRSEPGGCSATPMRELTGQVVELAAAIGAAAAHEPAEQRATRKGVRPPYGVAVRPARVRGSDPRTTFYLQRRHVWHLLHRRCVV